MYPFELFEYLSDYWIEFNLANYTEKIKGNPHWSIELEQELGGGSLYGGYMEDRSSVFDKRHETKSTIHLGVDYWVDAGTNVLSPIQGMGRKIRHCLPLWKSMDFWTP